MIGLRKYESDKFSPGYREVVNAFAVVHEAPPKSYDSVEVSESLVRCLWFDGMFRSEGLETEDHRPLRVLSPGRWNVESGPDFNAAQVSIAGGPVLSGDVEVHVNAEDWTAHGHDKNPAYDNVVLHVALWNRKNLGAVRNSQDKPVAQFSLARFLEKDIAEVVQTVDVEDYPAGAQNRAGLCRARLARGAASVEWLARFLDLAGDERILAKSRDMETLLRGRTLDRVFYEGVMEALGYKPNKKPFKQLAQRLPLEDIRRLVPVDADPEERACVLQGLMLGMAGLLPSQTHHDVSANDEETRLHAARLESAWAFARGSLAFQPLSLSDWQFVSMRPVNYPTRRIAGMSYLLADHLENGFFRAVIEALERARWSDPKASPGGVKPSLLDGLFAGANRGYWSRRYVFGGKVLARPVALIGKERARAIAVNVVIPLLLVHARQKADDALERKLHALYTVLPRADGNNVTRYMESTLFPSPETASEVVNSVRRQQGLYQIFKDCCDSQSLRCDDCVLVRAME